MKLGQKPNNQSKAMNKEPIEVPVEYVDHCHIANRQANEALAEEIGNRHGKLMEKKGKLAEEMLDVCDEALNVARLVEAAHANMKGKQFADWWRKHNLPVGWMERYMTIARTAGRHVLGDKDQLRLIGILPEAEHREGNDSRQQAPSGVTWHGFVGKLKTTLTEQLPKMGKVEREVALKALEPIERLIAELKLSA